MIVPVRPETMELSEAPPPKKIVRLTMSEAKKLKKLVNASFQKEADQLRKDILGIQDPQLKLNVAVLVEALADPENCAALILSEEDGQLNFVEFELDGDLFDTLSQYHGDLVEEAGSWLMMWLHEHPKPIVWLGWAFARTTVLNRKGRMEINNVVFDFDEGRTLGIMLNDAPGGSKRSTIVPLAAK